MFRKAVVSMIIVASLFAIFFLQLAADEGVQSANLRPEKTFQAQNAPGSPALRGDEVAKSKPAAANDAQSPAEGGNSFEKLVIAIGFFLVIILAFFKWGTSARNKKQEQ
jgi:hypothetical protein